MNNTEQESRAVSDERSVSTEANNGRLAVNAGPRSCLNESLSISERCDDHLASLYTIAYRYLGDHVAAAAAVTAAVAAAARLPTHSNSAPVPVWHLLATHFQAGIDRFGHPAAAIPDQQPHGPPKERMSMP